jgi:hypothetical protein
LAWIFGSSSTLQNNQWLHIYRWQCSTNNGWFWNNKERNKWECI